MKTCVLVAASDFNSKHFLEQAKAGAFNFVVAIDAGYAHLQSVNCAPNLVIGDFDSLGFVPKGQNVEKHPVKKDKSDMELAFDWICEHGFNDVVVYGALGGRLDHAIANIQLFARMGELGISVAAVDMDCMARIIVGPARFSLPVQESGVVSVFSLTPQSQGVCESGMEYSLDNAVLGNRTSLGLSNELVGSPASISVETGTLLVIYPLE